MVDGGDTEDAVSVRSRGLIARIALPSSALLALKSAISFGSLGAAICFTNTFIVRQQVQTLLVFEDIHVIARYNTDDRLANFFAVPISMPSTLLLADASTLTGVP